MGVAYNTKIQTSGLVLCLDPGNRVSYPGSGTTWFDLSSSQLNFSVTAANMTTPGLNSGAIASSSSTSILNNDSHTILFMIKFNTTATYGSNGYSGNWEQIIGYPAGGSDRTPGIWRNPSNRMIHWRYDPGNTGFSGICLNSDTTDFLIDTWYYVGVSKNGAAGRSYINGAFNTSATLANPKTSGSSAIYIFNGAIAGLMTMGPLHIYNRVLTDEEIKENFFAIRGRYGI
jgi:hypothetical protein